jgi:hypothetical protein
MASLGSMASSDDELLTILAHKRICKTRNFDEVETKNLRQAHPDWMEEKVKAAVRAKWEGLSKEQQEELCKPHHQQRKSEEGLKPGWYKAKTSSRTSDFDENIY